MNKVYNLDLSTVCPTAYELFPKKDFMNKKIEKIVYAKEIYDWHTEALPKADYYMITKKILEEAGELNMLSREWIFGRQKRPEYLPTLLFAQECADVYITLMALVTRYDIDIMSAVKNKLEVLKERKYRLRNGEYVR